MLFVENQYCLTGKTQCLRKERSKGFGMLNLNKGIVTSFLLGLVVHWSFGQSPTGDVDRAEWMRDQGGGPIVDTGTSNGVENGQAVSTPNDSDMGEQQILKRQTEYLPFTAAAGT